MNDPGVVVWLTGLSGAGKTTIGEAVCKRFRTLGHRAEFLDGDAMRKAVCKGLGFSREDRDENIRRIAYVAELLSRHGVIVIVAAIAPYRETRDEVRRGAGRYIEVYVNAPLEVCEARDPKNLYRRARAGEITGMTGIDDPYEAPLNPDVECHTNVESIEESVAKVATCIEHHLMRPTSRAARAIHIVS